MSDDQSLGLLEKFNAIDTHESLSNEQVLFILNRNIGLAAYTHEFVPAKRDSQILSGFIAALSSYMSEMTGQEATQWKTVYGPDSTMIVENGTWATGVIAVSRDTTETRSKLRMVVAEFEETFQHLKDSAEIEGSAFDEFDNFVRRVFTIDRISDRTLIYKITDRPGDIIPILPSIKFKIVKFLEAASDWQSVGEVATKVGYDLGEAIDIVSHAYWTGAISLLHVPADLDILMPSEESLSILLNHTNPTGVSPDTLRLTAALDGRTPLKTMMEDLDINNVTTTLLELGYLLNRGLLQRISTEGRFALIGECIASKVMQALVKEQGYDIVRPIFRDIVKEGFERYPWIGFLRLFETGRIRYPRVPGLTPEDIDSLTDALEFLVQSIANHMTKTGKKELADTIIRRAREFCESKYEHLLQNIVM